MSWTVSAQTADSPKKNCTPPRPTYQPAPPAYHVRKGLGVATLDVLVDAKGLVSDAKILDSSGSDKFDRDALSTVKRWKFKPSLCDGNVAPAHIAVQMQAHVIN